ncbi:MAG: PorT family protein [Prevotellaceae bacterium]|jgi:hypothetical protein|nr:PorT family protein [Prevotellaceae bacterium]
MLNDLNNGFEDLIRNKLEDYRTSVDTGNWDAIEKSLLRSKRLRYLYTTAGIVAAAVVMFLITLNLPDNNKKQTDKQTTAVLKDSTSGTTQSDEKIDVSGVDRQTTQKPNTANRQTPENRTEQEQPATNLAPIYKANTSTAHVEKPDLYPENPPVKDRLRIVPHSISGTAISISSSNKLQLPTGMRPTGMRPVGITPAGSQKLAKTSDNHIQPDNKKDIVAILDKNGLNSKKWSVSFGFGAGNYQTPTGGNSKNSDLLMAAPLLTSSNSVDYIRNEYRNEMKVPDNANAQHGLPLSAKFIVRKDFNARWAVESGLSYTFLSTKFKWSKNTANQQLHYLGIPLNVVCYVVSKPRWNIYASAGGMMEKGVYARINRSDNLATKVKMNGLQWSVNGAVGATYKLRKGLGVFFEPQFGYFFDNGQPESIRTEWPVSFGLGAGLRINF